MLRSVNCEIEPPQPPLPDQDPDPHLANSDSQEHSKEKESEATGQASNEPPDSNPQKQFNNFCKFMKTTKQEDFEQALHKLAEFFRAGFSKYFTSCTDLMRKMMNHFTTLGKRLRILSAKKRSTSDGSQIQFKMLFILSLIAELLSQNPKLYFPFTRRFLMNVFSIQRSMLQTTNRKNQILAILGTILENISKQGRLLRRYKVIADVKQTILINYEIISQLSTVQLFNKSISNLTRQGGKFTSEEFQKFKVWDTISAIMEKKNNKILILQMKIALMCGGIQSPDSNIKSQFEPIKTPFEASIAEELFGSQKNESTPEEIIESGKDSDDCLEEQI